MIETSLAILFYLAALTIELLHIKDKVTLPHKLVHSVLGAALLCHLITLDALFTVVSGQNFSLFNVFSLITGLMGGLLLLFQWRRRQPLMMVLFTPVAVLALTLAMLLPGTLVVDLEQSPGKLIHIIPSIIAYTLFALASLQAIILITLDKLLKTRKPSSMLRKLPPLSTIEHWLNYAITAGFVLLSFALASGFIYLQNLFAQHMVHKTVLTLLAWCCFAIYLAGHQILGWRGRTAAYWTFSGFGLLTLGYMGSKLVLEFFLN